MHVMCRTLKHNKIFQCNLLVKKSIILKMNKLISLTRSQTTAIQHITAQALREKHQPEFNETDRVGEKANSRLLETSVSSTLPNTAANETGIHSIVDTIFIHLGQEKLSKILATPKLLDRLFTRWYTALGKSIDEAQKTNSTINKESLQKKFLETINKKVEDHLFATCKSDKDLATKALNWAKVLSSDKINRSDLKTNFLHAVSYRYLNEIHLQTTTPDTDRAIKFIEQVSKSSPEILTTHINGININEKLQGVLYQQAFLIPNSDKSSFKKFEKLIDHLNQKGYIDEDKLQQFKLLIEMRYEHAHHGYRKTGLDANKKPLYKLVERTDQIAKLIQQLPVTPNDALELWNLCQTYDPKYNSAEISEFKETNGLPRIQIHDLILAVKTAQCLKYGLLEVEDLDPKQAATFYNFCNSTYFGSTYLNLIPGLLPKADKDPNDTYKIKLKKFKETYFTNEAPNLTVEGIPLCDNGQLQFFDFYAGIAKKAPEIVEKVSAPETLHSSLVQLRTKTTTSIVDFRSSVANILGSVQNKEELLHELEKNEAAPPTQNAGNFASAFSQTSELSQEIALDGFSTIQKKVMIKMLKQMTRHEKKLQEHDEKITACEKALRESRKDIEAIKATLEVEILLSDPDPIYKQLAEQIRIDLDIATSGLLNSEYTKNPSLTENIISIAGTAGDVFFGFGSIAATILNVVVGKVQSRKDTQKTLSLLEAKAALEVSNQGLANLIVNQLIKSLELKPPFKPGFVRKLSADIVKNLRSGGIKVDRSTNEITIDEEYASKLNKKLQKTRKN